MICGRTPDLQLPPGPAGYAVAVVRVVLAEKFDRRYFPNFLKGQVAPLSIPLLILGLGASVDVPGKPWGKLLTALFFACAAAYALKLVAEIKDKLTQTYPKLSLPEEILEFLKELKEE